MSYEEIRVLILAFIEWSYSPVPWAVFAVINIVIIGWMFVSPLRVITVSTALWILFVALMGGLTGSVFTIYLLCVLLYMSKVWAKILWRRD